MINYAGQKVVGYSVTRKSQMSFHYRYTCGHCGMQTNIYESMIETESTITKRGSNNNNFTVDEVMTTQKEANEYLLKRIQKIQEEKQRLNNHYYNGSLPFESLKYLGEYLKEADTCPHCGAVQPWKTRYFASSGMWTVGFFFIGLPVSFGVVKLFNLEDMGIPGLINAFVPLVATMILGFFLARFRRKKQIAKYLQDVAATANATKLEIYWNY
ncbi:MAG TPA: hypothetical protein GXZ76_01380 [Clostridiaceae bacterium]|jgi:ribosomal protein S27AE|nr:hypothetical protein [Clostridiaceae bacterium]